MRVLTYRMIGVSVNLPAARPATPSISRRSQIPSIKPIWSRAMLSVRMRPRQLESIRWIDRRPFGRTNGLADMALRVLGNVGEQSAHGS